MADNKVDKIILGTVQLGIDYGINNKRGKPSLSESLGILQLAERKGIRKLDTARAYGDSESVIGKFQKGSPVFEISSKFVLNSDSLKDQVTESLATLNVDHLYCLYFHRIEDLKHNRELLNEMVDLKDKGLIQHIGISFYPADKEYNWLLEIDEIDVLQFPYNLLDNWNQKGKFIQDAKRSNKELHARSVFLQGLLFMDAEELPGRLCSLTQPLKKIQKIAKELDFTISELALNYVLQNEYIDYVLFGVESENQLQKNLAAIRKEIPKSWIDEISSVTVNEKKMLNPTEW